MTTNNGFNRFKRGIFVLRGVRGIKSYRACCSREIIDLWCCNSDSASVHHPVEDYYAYNGIPLCFILHMKHLTCTCVCVYVVHPVVFVINIPCSISVRRLNAISFP